MQEDRELSNTWLELLGKQVPSPIANNSTIPALESDPWSSLLQGQDVQIIDLQKAHIPMSDSDVEQLLYFIQDSST